jgi:hypothetical protein
MARFAAVPPPNPVMIPSDCNARPCRDKHSKSQNAGIAMKKLIAVTVALAALATLTGPVYAQRTKQQTPLQIEEAQRKQERERIEKQYDAALKKTDRSAATSPANDPWANMRGTDDPKTRR